MGSAKVTGNPQSASTWYHCLPVKLLVTTRTSRHTALNMLIGLVSSSCSSPLFSAKSHGLATNCGPSYTSWGKFSSIECNGEFFVEIGVWVLRHCSIESNTVASTAIAPKL